MPDQNQQDRSRIAQLPTDSAPTPAAVTAPLGTIHHAKGPSRRVVAALAGIVVLGMGVGAWILWPHQPSSSTASQNPRVSTSTASPAAEQPATTLALSTDKAYGDKYASGLLPVGDNHYVTNGPKKGYIYMCQANFVPTSQAGAQKRGPWFVNNNTQWDMNKKSHIAGQVSWKPSMSVAIQNGKRVIMTNDLPDHYTGTFPVAANDPARTYDANPNSIKAQALTYTLDANPTAGNPSCMGGEVGVMLTGAAIFNGFDAGGRDAGAWEVQDGCDGHPQEKGEYHYHTLSRCIKDTSVGTVIGYALDGFPITGPKVADKNYLTTDDLDECHGITSTVTMDGKSVKTYHYVMTQDFPYSVSCFRGTATKAPGLPGGQPQTSGQPQASGQPPASGRPNSTPPPPPPGPGQPRP